MDVHPIETVAAEGAGPESATVHWDGPGAVTVVGLQESALSEGETDIGLIVTVVPDPVAAIAVPEPETATGLTSRMALDVEVVVFETVKVATARVPSAIALAFKPLTRQMYCPELGALQVIALPAPDADGPAATETPLKSDGEKVNDHCSPEA